MLGQDGYYTVKSPVILRCLVLNFREMMRPSVFCEAFKFKLAKSGGDILLFAQKWCQRFWLLTDFRMMRIR